MNTKLFFIIGFLTCTFSVSLNAQKNRLEMIKEEKMSFINDYCKFTQDEANKFWPVHDEMQGKLKEVRKTMRKELKDIKNTGVDNVSETDLKKAMDNWEAYEKKLVDIKWEYNDKFVTLVGIKKTAKFYEAETAFRKKLIERLKDLKLDGKGEDDED